MCEVARGGRYDNFTEPLDSSLPATGFSADIKVLSRLSSAIVDDTARIILAPDTDDLELHNVIRDIRASGDIVIQELPGNQKQPEHTAVIEKIGGRWQVSE